jgi:hypothetical protein
VIAVAALVQPATPRAQFDCAITKVWLFHFVPRVIRDAIYDLLAVGARCGQSHHFIELNERLFRRDRRLARLRASLTFRSRICRGAGEYALYTVLHAPDLGADGT